MDDDFGDDADFLAVLEATEARAGSSRQPPQAQFQQRPPFLPPAAPPPPPQPQLQQHHHQRIQQPQPQRLQQPIPQRLDRAPPSSANTTPNGAGQSGQSKIVQPTPQALPARSSGSSILVSPRQKGNPVLACIKSMPWEYSDIPADYVLGVTTCALFLSLKYHRLHPEYIYTRIRNLQGKYNLRILLTMVDIPNHEDALRELSKTSLVNNVTVLLCWSAAEAARYLELYKSYEHAGFSAIRGQQATGYAEKLVEFVTVPRSINKADAVSLVSTFGSLRHAVNADPGQVSIVGGWGERKVKSWCKAVEQPFRVKKAAKRKVGSGVGSTSSQGAAATTGTTITSTTTGNALPSGRLAARAVVGTGVPVAAPGPQATGSGGGAHEVDDFDDEDALIAAAAAAAAAAAEDTSQPKPQQRQAQKPARPEGEDGLSEGIAAALARLREKG